MKETSTPPMIENAKPLCPRDNNQMHFDANGTDANNGGERIPSYHCKFYDCDVRFNITTGYFTVETVLEHPNFIEEPGTNLLQCPRHGTWLYRSENEQRDGEKFVWRCGAQGCDYMRDDVGGIWLRE